MANCDDDHPITNHRHAAPWYADKIPGYVVRDAKGKALAYVYSRATESEAIQAKVLTADEARRVAVNFAQLPELLKREARLGYIPGSHPSAACC